MLTPNRHCEMNPLVICGVIEEAIKQALREEISFSQQHKWGQYLPTWNHVDSLLEPGINIHRVNHTKESLFWIAIVSEKEKGFPSPFCQPYIL